ncbi:hypothetical protein AVEN_244099-1 [Araneus ventricosus]|uniref:Uncharacterized protein n=1 Tax=Araneus ventricosus TaxID=182803 RepID=A0A4Y2IJ22_ARAVE|nr:hypothetical protein AVEN_244099-1 [Araneus ventricosus]
MPDLVGDQPRLKVCLTKALSDSVSNVSGTEQCHILRRIQKVDFWYTGGGKSAFMEVTIANLNGCRELLKFCEMECHITVDETLIVT